MNVRIVATSGNPAASADRIEIHVDDLDNAGIHHVAAHVAALTAQAANAVLGARVTNEHAPRPVITLSPGEGEHQLCVYVDNCIAVDCVGEVEAAATEHAARRLADMLGAEIRDNR